jgi:hypothetical protein
MSSRRSKAPDERQGRIPKINGTLRIIVENISNEVGSVKNVSF